MKRFLTLCLLVFAMLWALSGCGRGGENADIVFINDSDATIGAVTVDFQDQSGGTQNADSSPLKRGETFGFEAGEYPVTVTVYETPPEPFSEAGDRWEALVSAVIQKAPPEGERWYVTARDSRGDGGLLLTVDQDWPEGVPEVTTGGVWFPSGTILSIPLLWGPLALLAAVCVLTLNHLEPQRRRGLFALFFTMLGVAAVLFGGAWALDENGLAWRTWVQEGMSAILWLLGLVTGIMTIVYARRWLVERFQTRGKVLLVLSALGLVSAMFVGTIVGGLWCLGPAEQVGTYQGQKVVQGKWVWQECIYELYEYRGPLVRGAQSFQWSEEPLIDGLP